MIKRIKSLAATVFAFSVLLAGQAFANEEIMIWYVERNVERAPTLSDLDPVETDIGLQGAQLGAADSNTTGKFLGHVYTLPTLTLSESEDLLSALQGAAGIGNLIVVRLPSEDLLTLADAMPEALIFNASSPANALRNEACRRNVLHTLPSRSMLTDALAQFLLKKKWTDWLLLVGPRDSDISLGRALRRSATKFGNKIVEDVDWSSKTDLQRDAHEEVPRLTNGADHDVVVVADELGDFSRYLPYNTYRPRPVAGSEGLVPTGWSRVLEQWGAAQLQSRFAEQAGRPMREVDYAAWAAVRSIAEAVTRTGKTDPGAIRSYLLSDKFQLAAFKGRKMSFRTWNGQLRQPIPLVHTRALVAQAPIDGFLHPVTELDTLGFDRSESLCKEFTK